MGIKVTVEETKAHDWSNVTVIVCLQVEEQGHKLAIRQCPVP